MPWRGRLRHQAGALVPLPDRLQLRFHFGADRLRMRAAGVKAAAARRRYGAGGSPLSGEVRVRFSGSMEGIELNSARV